mgnify:CR=1 FL=1
MTSIDVNYGRLKRYDTTRPPMKQRFFFTAVLRALCGLSMAGQDYKIEKINMEGLKPPYILLCNHMYTGTLEYEKDAGICGRASNELHVLR